MLKALRRYKNCQITCQILLQIKDQLCFCLSKDIVFWAACLIGYFGLLRKRTLLPVTAKDPGDSCILRKDLVMDGNSGFTLNIRKTKTIQCGERVLSLPFVSCPGSPLCPYEALTYLLLVSPRDPELPLFSYRHKGAVSWWSL